jgi:hypothetical protein
MLLGTVFELTVSVNVSFFCFTFVFGTGLGCHQKHLEHHLDYCLSGSGLITGTTSNFWPPSCDVHVPQF